MAARGADCRGELDTVDEFKCAFSATLLGGDFGCRRAQTVTRRGGPDMACTSGAGHARCEALLQRMKLAALPAFGVEDDLLSMPHSTLVKVQFGGLLGLQRLLEGQAAARVDDVDALAERAVGHYGGTDAVPFQDLVADMTSFRLRRRGAK
jgi:hypothetical protein